MFNTGSPVNDHGTQASTSISSLFLFSVGDLPKKSSEVTVAASKAKVKGQRAGVKRGGHLIQNIYFSPAEVYGIVTNGEVVKSWLAFVPAQSGRRRKGRAQDANRHALGGGCKNQKCDHGCTKKIGTRYDLLT